MCGLKTQVSNAVVVRGEGGKKKKGWNERTERGRREVNACGNVLDETGYSKPGGSPPPAPTHVLLQHTAATCSTYTSQRERTDWGGGSFFFLKGKVRMPLFHSQA